MTNVLFIELESALSDGAAFDALVSGTYTDMNGRVVEFKAENLQGFVDNTQAAIDATKAESGEVVGLPIDARDHDKGDGAGWIVGIELSGGIIRVIPKWTDIGRDLIARGVRRFFSATVDVANQVILGGTLTNWPATRDKSGRIQLRPIELESSNLKEVVNMADEKTPEVQEQETPEPEAVDVDALREEIRAEIVAEFQTGDGQTIDLAEARDALVTQLKAEVQADVSRMVEQMRQESHIAEFSQRVVSGTEVRPFGLPVGQEEVETFLLSLNEEQRAAGESILTRIHEQGLVQFSEIGHGKKMKGISTLPAEFSATLASWVADGNTVKEWFDLNPEAGAMDQYKLDEFEEGE